LTQNKILLEEFDYELPDEKIARFPAERRDLSRLLFYNKGTIHHEKFSNIPYLLPSNSVLFFNDTKVVRARLHFQKKSGATIEIFPIDPVVPEQVEQSMSTRGSCSWKCLIGNLKRWKGGDLSLSIKTNAGPKVLKARLLDIPQGVVEFTWNSVDSFAEILDIAGEIPLPPYLKRKPVESDTSDYQTIYSARPGGVASPTAGLHFTPEVLEQLRKNSFELQFLTLHVSAGTFKPVTENNIIHHRMHQEQVIISADHVESLLNKEKIIAVGTTSLRTLESIYWYGVKLLTGKDPGFFISQQFPYEQKKEFSREAALGAILSHFAKQGITSLSGKTQIFIYPGYDFRICQGLITNFHLPKSSLLMLVSAFVGNDWKKIYQSALDNHYRFLSYGDSSLLLPNP